MTSRVYYCWWLVPITICFEHFTPIDDTVALHIFAPMARSNTKGTITRKNHGGDAKAVKRKKKGGRQSGSREEISVGSRTSPRFRSHQKRVAYCDDDPVEDLDPTYEPLSDSTDDADDGGLFASLGKKKEANKKRNAGQCCLVGRTTKKGEGKIQKGQVRRTWIAREKYQQHWQGVTT